MNQGEFIPTVATNFNLNGFKLVDFEIHSFMYASPTRDYYIFEVFFAPLESVDAGHLMRARFMGVTLDELVGSVKQLLKTINLPAQEESVLKIVN